MKKIILISGGLAAILVLAVLVAAATRPDTFTVKRSIAINAPPDWVFPLINHFERWRDWSPWEHKDPAMKRAFGPHASGKGAIYSWSGNNEVGQGKMEIIEVKPPSLVRLKLDFFKPFKAQNEVDFTLEQRGGGTEVVWSMRGPLTFTQKVAHLFMDMDALVGKDFEAGLANLKARAEKP
jgi:uncharacterized protein YndB with AHSA1/START domain